MKNILITGGSRGIGAAIAKALSIKDYRVIINYNKSKDEAQEVLNYIKERTVGYMVKADISKPEEVDAMFSEIECMVGPVDILINNAGIAMYGLFQDASIEEIENLFKINVGGLINVTRRALRYDFNEGGQDFKFKLHMGHSRCIKRKPLCSNQGGNHLIHQEFSKRALI